MSIKKFKSVFFVLTLLLAASFTLTSCSGDDDNDNNTVYKVDQYEKGILGQWKYESNTDGYFVTSGIGREDYNLTEKYNFSFSGSTGSFTSYKKYVYTSGSDKGKEEIIESAIEFKYEWKDVKDYWGEVEKTLAITVTKVNKGDIFKVGEEIHLTVDEMSSNKLTFNHNDLVGLNTTLTR